MPKKILKRPFLTTFATVVVAASVGACGNNVTQLDESSSSGSGTGASSSSSSTGGTVCPSVPPPHGAPCNGAVSFCEYGDPCQDNEQTLANCNDGVWDVVTSTVSCNPPPPTPECPVDMPVHDTSCEPDYQTGDDYNCIYFDGGCDITATCSYMAGTWSVLTPPCNPPPPDICYQFSDENTCASELGCVWYVPGCDANPISQASCHPVDGCDVSNWCNDAQVCAQVSIDPCHGQPCDACGEQVWACEPI